MFAGPAAWRAAVGSIAGDGDGDGGEGVEKCPRLPLATSARAGRAQRACMSALISRRALSAARLWRCARWNSMKAGGAGLAQVDRFGIPLEPTWSVHELLSSYPKPTLSDAALRRLHDLSALVPPKEGTEEHKRIKHELEELIRLVEAVKLVDTTGVEVAQRPDTSADATPVIPSDEPSGRELLKHAEKTEDGFYVIDANRRR
ncbi:hypothetical protein EV121DRAFT_205857 [Schizophyllum commune]